MPDKLTAEPLTVEPAPATNPWLRKARLIYFAILLLGFASTLYALVFHAAVSELHSYILLVPFISAYLIYIQRDRLPKVFSPSVGPGAICGIVGLLALGAALTFGPWSANDYFTIMALSFVCLLLAGGFFFLGRQWMAAAAFPAAFLFFFVPMPDAMADTLETASQLASAEAASFFFSLSGSAFHPRRDDFSITQHHHPSGAGVQWNSLELDSVDHQPVGVYLF